MAFIFFHKIVIHLEIIFFTLRFPLYVYYSIKYLIFIAKMTHILLNENEFHWFTNFIWILTQYNQSTLCQFPHFFYSALFLALFSEKQGDKNSSKLFSNLLSNLEEREHLTLELLGNITGVALIYMPVLKQSLCSRGCGASIHKTYTFVYIWSQRMTSCAEWVLYRETEALMSERGMDTEETKAPDILNSQPGDSH